VGLIDVFLKGLKEMKNVTLFVLNMLLRISFRIQQGIYPCLFQVFIPGAFRSMRLYRYTNEFDTAWCWKDGLHSDHDMVVAIAKALMEDINSLKLLWLSLLPSTIKDEWGGWVSKNYASLLCVALWVFAPIMTVDNADAYTDPMGDPTKWTVKMYQVWLRARGLDLKGKRNDLSERVLPFFVPSVIAPPILPQQYATANEMIEMLQSLVLMVATVFQKSVDAKTKNLLDLRICLFLTRFQRFDKPM
jgi:hypothetical protein